MSFKKNYRVALILFIIVFLLTSCYSSQNDLYDDLMNDIPSTEKDENNITAIKNTEKELSGTLTVTTFFDGYINIHAKNFMHTHPNVDIQIIRSDENEFETLEAYASRMAVELMNGTATDLVDLSGLDINRYAKSGLLCDLYKFMDKDSTFDKADYYTNIFEAMEYEKALYAMPFAFLYDMVYVSKPMSEKLNLDLINVDGINYIEMIDIYEKAKKQHNSPQTFGLMPGAIKESFFDYEIIEFYDAKTGTVRIKSDDFIEHLNLTKSISTEYSPDKGGWYMTRIADGNDDFMKSDFMFSKFESNAIDLYNNMIEYKNILGPIPLLNSVGNAPFKTFSSTYAIPQSSQNKELAWEFLKYCISSKNISDFENEEEELKNFMMYQGLIPINIENFYTSFRHNFIIEIKRIKEAAFDVKWKSEKEDEMINDTLDKIHNWNLKRNKLVSDFELWTLVKQDLQNFYYFNLAKAEETASIIHNKVLTYLSE